MDNLLTEEEIYNDCKSVFEGMFEGETISDLCYFKAGWVMKACEAVLQTQLSKLLTAAPDVREKVNQYLIKMFIGVELHDVPADECMEEAEYIHALYLPAILAAADEARREGRKEERRHGNDKFWNITNKILHELNCRWWITEGRGSYAYDDDRYREETRYAFEAIQAMIEEAQIQMRQSLGGKA